MTTTAIGVNGDVVCPPTTSHPCDCRESSNYPNGLYVGCAYLSLSDAAMSKILNVFLYTKGVSPVVELNAYGNSLTKEPSQISQFTATSVTIYLSYNQISSISSGAFSYPNATSVHINLWSNKITSILSGAFSFPKAKSISIGLEGNKITSISSSSFNFPNASAVDIRLNDHNNNYYYDYYNQITSLPSGAFSFPNATSVQVDLWSNNITSIAPSAFSHSRVGHLSNNFFSRVEVVKLINSYLDYDDGWGATSACAQRIYLFRCKN